MNKNEIHILLVDDDRQNSLLLIRFLELEGYSVTYASDGAAAWEMYNRQHPDLILLDVNMPVMNGFELAQKIRETDSEVFLFFLTDRTEKADRLKGFHLKGNDYIPKPFYPEELIARIDERFENRKVDVQCRYMIGKHYLTARIQQSHTMGSPVIYRRVRRIFWSCCHEVPAYW